MINAIKERTSIRTYTGEKLSNSDLSKIKEYIDKQENLIGPFGNQIILEYIDYNGSQAPVKIGTYGFIKGHAGFIVGVCQNTEEAILDYGYVFEKLILFLTKEGIGTCWLGGTFTRDRLKTLIEMKENDIIPAITPVGYPHDKRRLKDKLIRKVAGSNNRLPYKQLFYNKDFQSPLEENIEALELVQLGPSASNKQPWRIVVDQNITHFYIKRTENYGKGLKYDMQLLDMGIAMSHYEYGCHSLGKWVKQEPNILCEDKEYIISYQAQ